MELLDSTALHQVDDAGCLFISPIICDWSVVAGYGVDTVIDLEGGLDQCIPSVPNGCLYVYFPIYDEQLPEPRKLEAVVALGASLVANGHRVLSHCGMGYNRSALIAGLILNRLGMRGEDVVARLQERRPGALFNDVFAEHLRSLP
jgi:hypothetical protein